METTMRPLATTLLTLTLALSGCATETECEYIEQAPTGDLAQDIQGCWQTFFANVVVTYNFEPATLNETTELYDGTYHYIAPPNAFDPDGLVSFSPTYTLDPEESFVSLEGFVNGDYAAQVTETSLILDSTVQNQRLVLRRATACRGFGFDLETSVPCP